jgi:hypothetical protein
MRPQKGSPTLHVFHYSVISLSIRASFSCDSAVRCMSVAGRRRARDAYKCSAGNPPSERLSHKRTQIMKFTPCFPQDNDGSHGCYSGEHVLSKSYHPRHEDNIGVEV